MIPIVLLSLVTIYIFVERLLVLRDAARQDNTFMQRIKDYIHAGDVESALNLCKKNPTPVARLIEKGITRLGRPMNDVLVAIERCGKYRSGETRTSFHMDCHYCRRRTHARILGNGNRYGKCVL